MTTTMSHLVVPTQASPTTPSPASDARSPGFTAGTWTIDPTTAQVAFAGRVSRFAPEFRARFDAVQGCVAVEPDTGVSLAVDIPLSSMTTGNSTWDELLRVLDPFHLTRHPIASYRSCELTWTAGGGHLDGRLDLHGVTRPVRLSVSHAGREASGALRVRANGLVDRQEFGIRCDLPGVGRLVPRRMALEIDVQALPTA